MVTTAGRGGSQGRCGRAIPSSSRARPMDPTRRDRSVGTVASSSACGGATSRWARPDRLRDRDRRGALGPLPGGLPPTREA